MAKKCEQCGTPALDDQSEYCNRCGASVREEPKINVPVCKRCKSPAPGAEVRFCNQCGAEFPDVEPHHTHPLCPRCGNTIHDDLSAFCNMCGSPVRQEPEPHMPICSRCKSPAHDKESLFCNRCGTGYKKEPEKITPLCPRCGYLIPDDLSQFCNRCGTAIAPEPVDKKPVCKKCGTPALDEETLFCNRCGTPFDQPLSDPGPFPTMVHKPTPPLSVRISPKKQVPALVVPYDLWDPVLDEEFAPAHHQPPVAPPASPLRKKYAHLPLIADELKEKQSPRLEIESPYFPGPPLEKKKGKPKKGFFDLLKK